MRQHRPFSVLPLTAALALGLAACGGDDDDAADVTVPEVTADASAPETMATEPTTPGATAPEQTTPGTTASEAPDVTEVSVPEFSGEGSDAFCAEANAFGDMLDGLDDDDVDVFPQLLATFEELQDGAPEELAGDLEVLHGAVEQMLDGLTGVHEEFGPGNTSPEARAAASEAVAAAMSDPAVVQAGANMSAYTEQFCEPAG